MKALPLLIIPLFILSCKGVSQKGQANYKNAKAGFDTELVDHFPKELTVTNTVYNSYIDEATNNIGFYLCEYDVDISDIHQLVNESHRKSIHVYSSDADQLLIVNRFVTLEKQENDEPPVIDTLLTNNELYEGLYPVPNFLQYRKAARINGTRLPDRFDLYVLEAKNTTRFSARYKLGSNPQMPVKWKNGYSKGVAVNEHEGTVIYWAITW